MLELTIQPASLQELDTILAWRMEVLEHVFGPMDGQAYQTLYAANESYYKAHLPERHKAVWIKEGNTIVGCAGVCLQEEMPSPDNPTGRNAYIMNVYVRAAWRKRHGAAKAVGWLIQAARDWKAGKIYLETSTMGRPLYTALGFADMKDYMKLEDSPHDTACTDNP